MMRGFVENNDLFWNEFNESLYKVVQSKTWQMEHALFTPNYLCHLYVFVCMKLNRYLRTLIFPYLTSIAGIAESTLQTQNT